MKCCCYKTQEKGNKAFTGFKLSFEKWVRFEKMSLNEGIMKKKKMPEETY